MQMLCYLTDGEKQNGIERINHDVKYLRGERDAKTLTSGKYVAANSLLILVDGENSGEVLGLRLTATKVVLSNSCLSTKI
jgi:type I restriction enzyme S subunit